MELCKIAQMDHWDDIRLALAVVRRGGLAPAARALGLSHSTLSRRIAAFEQRKGVRLFDRLPEGLHATAAGLELMRAAERIEAEIGGLEVKLAGAEEEAGGVLKVTAPSLLIQAYLGPVLRDFAIAHPDIELHVNAAHAPLDLSRREADVAIRATNQPSEALFGRRVVRQQRAVYASKAYFERKPGLTPDDAIEAGFEWLGFDWWNAELVKAYPGSRQVARFDDMVALLGALKAGLGVARLPVFIGEPDPDLQRLTGFQAEPYLDFWVLTHPSLKNIGRIREFMAFVATRFERDQARFMLQ